MTVKCAVDESFMHCFQNFHWLLGLLTPAPYWGDVYGPRWGRKPQTP